MRAEFESEHCGKVSLHHTFALFDPLKRRQADPGRARTMMARAPVPEICHSLLASNHDPRKPLEAWLRLAAVGAAANGAGCAGAHSGSLSNNRVAPVNIDLHVDWRCMPGSGLSPRSARSRRIGRSRVWPPRVSRAVVVSSTTSGSGHGGAALPPEVKHFAEYGLIFCQRPKRRVGVPVLGDEIESRAIVRTPCSVAHSALSRLLVRLLLGIALGEPAKRHRPISELGLGGQEAPPDVHDPAVGAYAPH
jgi:hypothetical protein